MTDTDYPLRELGRYRLCLELATGGMSSVHLARAEGARGFEKLVALKVIHPHLAKERGFVEMFLDEARIASRIDHPNVCHVFDFGCASQTYYLAMEYLVGEPLSRVMRAERAANWFPENRVALVARLIADACEGLHAAHELAEADGSSLEVVHRDISPHNLFLTFDGVCKVVDFGIARARGRLHDTVTGTVKGKFAYMAPEQLQGQTVDRRADVWSMGVVLCELLIRERLFRRQSDGATATAVLNGPITLPSKAQPDVPPALDRIVERALQRDPNARYATARELGMALLDHATYGGRPVGLPDLSAWMVQLFPAGRRERASLEAAALQAGQEMSPAPNVASSPESPSRLVARGRRRNALVVAAIVVAAFGGLAAGVIGAGGGSDTPDAPAASAGPPPATEEPPVAPATEEAPVAPATEEAPVAPATVEESPEPETAHTATASTSTPRRPTGTVNVATPGGWATVSVRGRVLGTTPLRAALPAGPQVLEILPFGRGPPRMHRIRVRPGAVVRVRYPVSAR